MASKVDGYIGKINPGDGTNYAIGSTAYGVCETAASTAAKTVDMDGFVLTTGATIHVYFKNGNAAATPTLNVNNTGAKEIRLLSVYSPSPAHQIGIEMLTLTYDGLYWVVNNPRSINKYSPNLYAGGSSSTGHIATTNGNTYLIPVISDGYSGVSYGSYKVHLVPGNNMEVTSDGYGNVTFNSPGQILIYDIASFSSLPQTVTDSLITADHVLLRSELGTPTAQASNWTVTTAAGSLTVSGTMTSSSSTTMRLVLGIPANPPAST